MIEPITRTSTTYAKDAQKGKNIVLALGGDKAAFSKIIINMENKLYRISRSVLREDADCADAIQEALIRAWLKLPTLHNPERFEHWLVRILLRECYRIAKKTKYFALEKENTAYIDADPTEHMDLHEAMYKLKIEHRAPLILHHMMGYKVYEIAQMLNVPAGTIKSRLMRGRKKLKSIIKEQTYEKL